LHQIWDRVLQEFGETQTPSFVLVDLELSCKIIKNLNVSAGVQNVFNESYYEHLNRSVKGVDSRPTYASGRSFFCSFNMTFF